jgi:hypothetical protein
MREHLGEGQTIRAFPAEHVAQVTPLRAAIAAPGELAFGSGELVLVGVYGGVGDRDLLGRQHAADHDICIVQAAVFRSGDSCSSSSDRLQISSSTRMYYRVHVHVWMGEIEG